MFKETLCLSAAAVLLSACGGSSDGKAKISVAVTDAPVDQAEQVVVKIVGLEIKKMGASGEESSNESPGNGWVDLGAVEKSIDLLSLQGDDSEPLVDDVEIEPGVYKIRFAVEAAPQSCQNLPDPLPSYVVIDGTRYPIAIGSGELKTKAFTIAAGGRTDYTVDFDLRQALADRGNSDCFNLNPTSLRIVDNAEVGTLAGSVDAALMSNELCTGADSSTGEGYSVFVFDGEPNPLVAGEEVTSALLLESEGSFSYEVGFLLAGEYRAALACNTSEGSVEFLQTIPASIAASDEPADGGFSATAP